MNFDLQACRFHFLAQDTIRFPAGSVGNSLRGALGSILRKLECAEDCPGHAGLNIRECPRRITCPYASIFEPTAAGGAPSGLTDWPRPFVIRGGALELRGGQAINAGDEFCFDLNLFDMRHSWLDHFTRAFAQWSKERRAEMVAVEQSAVTVQMDATRAAVSRIRVEFRTPTELKAGSRLDNTVFPVLLARARDRLSTLRSLYGEGPFDIDFRALAERARLVKTVHSDLRQVAVERRSSRTGQRHSIGGLVGLVEYEGDLAEFLPYLEAARWTGVGRHCTWGNGQIDTVVLG